MMSIRILKIKLLCLLFGVTTVLPAMASQPSVESAIDRLSAVSVFAIGGVGFAGSTSQGEKDFLIVLGDAHAMQSFENLYQHGNAQGRAYALLGIYSIDPARFHALSSPVSESTEKVKTMSGCIMSTETLGAVVKDIGAGGFHPTDKAK